MCDCSRAYELFVALKSMKKVDTEYAFDAKKAFKTLFVTNKFDGTEDYLIDDKLKSLVYEEMSKFRFA